MYYFLQCMYAFLKSRFSIQDSCPNSGYALERNIISKHRDTSVSMFTEALFIVANTESA